MRFKLEKKIGQNASAHWMHFGLYLGQFQSDFQNFFPLKAYDKGFPAKTHRDRNLGGLGASGAPEWVAKDQKLHVEHSYIQMRALAIIHLKY